MWLCCFQCVCVCVCVCVRAHCQLLISVSWGVLSSSPCPPEHRSEGKFTCLISRTECPPPTLSFLPASLQRAKEPVKEGRWSSLLWRSGLKQTSKCCFSRGVCETGHRQGGSSGRFWSWCNFDELLKAQVLRRRPARGRVRVLLS